MQHIHQHAVARLVRMGVAIVVGGLEETAQQFASVGQGIGGRQVAVDGEVGGGDDLPGVA